MLCLLAWLEIRQRCHWRAAIPGANVLANIAAEDVIADRFPQFQRDGAAQLDGEIRNAAPRVQNIRLYNCAGGACVNAKACSCRTNPALEFLAA